jgi:hypothetical protein
VRDQLQELEKEGHITFAKFNNYAEDLSDTCTEYIQEQCLPFLMPFQPMDWIDLKGKVTWKNVQVQCVFKQNLPLDEDDTCLMIFLACKNMVKANWKRGMGKKRPKCY